MTDDSKTFKEKKEITKLKKELETSRHKNRMLELAYERETSKLVHEQILERNRIKYAEERKMLHERHYSP